MIVVFLVPARVSEINSSADDCLVLEHNNTLTCVSIGIPQPSIHWFIEDVNNTIVEGDKYTIRGDQLIINNVNYSDIDMSYGCVAHNIINRVIQMDNITKFYPACSKHYYMYLDVNQFTHF